MTHIAFSVYLSILLFLVFGPCISQEHGLQHIAVRPRYFHTLNRQKFQFMGGQADTVPLQSPPSTSLKRDAANPRTEPLRATSLPSHSSSSVKACKPTYGVLPCTNTIVGGLFLLLIYGIIIYTGAKYLAEGSELLLLVLDVAVVGGLILPIFGVLPDSILVLASGIGGGKSEAQEEVLVGIGVLAGSDIMLLTLLWGTCLLLGRCDLKTQNGELHSLDKQLTRPCDLFGTGVEIDEDTRLSAIIMCFSVIPFLILQSPHVFHASRKAERVCILTACILAFLGLIVYCSYQMIAPEIRRRRKIRAIFDSVMLRLVNDQFGREYLLSEGNKLNEKALRELFEATDRDQDGCLTRDEVCIMLHVASWQERIRDGIVKHFMETMDENRNEKVTWEEFVHGMDEWCKSMKNIHTLPFLSDEEMEEFGVVVEDLMYSSRGADHSKTKILRKASFFLAMGMVMVGVFAEPLVDAVTDFSHASHIPSFFVSFVLLPIASNASEAISSIIFASRKQKVHISLTYSQIYGGVTMNNTMSLGILLAIIYSGDLDWNFSSEVLMIFVVTLFMGITAICRRVLPLWTALLALSLYPLSVGVIVILDHVLGWK
ncbi:hypothetical protein KP509_1Z041000 [Ceratopteris richardii]|nr:hypothetical protein KP509_1Z041000 [Ceratopteris richardii]